RGHDHKEADTLLGAQMSAPIAAGLALVDGAVGVQSFAPDSLGRARVRQAIERIDVRVDEECEREYPKRRSGAVRIELTDGRVLERRVLDPKGEGMNPLTDTDLERKFRANCEPLLGVAGCDAGLEIMWNFRRDASALASIL